MPAMKLFLKVVLLGNALLLNGLFLELAHATVEARLLAVFGKEGDAPGQFRFPNGVSMSPKGILYVADTGNHRIQKFSDNGDLQTFIGGIGWASEQFQRPMDLCASNGLDVYVADYENNRIERYDKDLNWVESIAANPSVEEKLQFALPTSVGISIHGDLFILDSEKIRVLKINANRAPESSFASYDWGQGALSHPGQLVVSRNDQIFVSDKDQAVVLIYDYFGNYLGSIGQSVLRYPQGLDVDQDGNIFVADSDLDQVIMFSSSGAVLLRMGSSGSKAGAFRNPCDVAVLHNRLFVADTDNHRIQVFKILAVPSP